MKAEKHRLTNDLKPGTSLVARNGSVDAYVLLRHENGHAVWLNLITAVEMPMAEGKVDELSWKVVEP